MPNKLFHAFVSSKSDSVDSGLVRPSNWNAALKFSNLNDSAPSSTDAFVRYLNQGNVTYYVLSSGSDNNSGLANTSTGAFATIQAAISTLVNSADLAFYTATIQVGTGTYNGIYLPIDQVGGAISVVGSTTTPSNVVLSANSSASPNGPGTINLLRSNMTLSGVTLSSTSGDCISASNGALLNFNTIVFSSCPGSHIHADTGAYILCGSSYSMSGSAQKHITSNNNSFVQIFGGTNTSSAALSFSVAFCDANNCGTVGYGGGATFASTTNVTGKRFTVDLNGVINTGGQGDNFFPGTSSGSITTGGQYA